MLKGGLYLASDGTARTGANGTGSIVPGLRIKADDFQPHRAFVKYFKSGRPVLEKRRDITERMEGL